MPLIHKKNSDFAAFIGAQSLHKPALYDDPDATANANLAARLPYLFATCRFAHYLKCIVRDKIGSFKERDDMQRWLQNWIMQYVDGDPAHSSEDDQGAQPARRRRGDGRGGRRESGLLHLEVLPRPHYQLEGLTSRCAGVEAAVGQIRIIRMRSGLAITKAAANARRVGEPCFLPASAAARPWLSSRRKSGCNHRCSTASPTKSPTNRSSRAIGVSCHPRSCAPACCAIRRGS